MPMNLPQKKPHKGRPKSNKRDPSRWEHRRQSTGTAPPNWTSYMDVGKEAMDEPMDEPYYEPMDESMDKPYYEPMDEPMDERMDVDDCGYKKQFLEFMIPHIRDVRNVKGDGNCGWRSIAQCLYGSEDLWSEVKVMLKDEVQQNPDRYAQYFSEVHRTSCDDVVRILSDLSSPVNPSKWFSPDLLGPVVATRFQMLFVVHTDTTCGQGTARFGTQTFFPVVSTDVITSDSEVITVGLVNNNHFVHLIMEEDCPLPSPSMYNSWICSKAQVKYLSSVFRHRFEMYKRLSR